MRTILWAVLVLGVTVTVLALGGWQLSSPSSSPSASGVRATPAKLVPAHTAAEARRTTRPQRTTRRTTIETVPVLEPGPTLHGPGDEGPEVREMQARLRQIFWLSGDVSDYYGDISRAAVAGFQTKRGLLATGSLDTVTLERLEGMTTEPTSDGLANIEPEPVVTADGATLDPRCETGRVLCIDKSTNSLRWVVDGDVQLTLDARFGGNGYTTREGQFAVNRKSRDHVSSIYDTSMPFAMFFSGGQAVHYSPDFAATGYSGASHGCVNIRDYDAIAGLYDEVRLGDTVVVYWS